MRVDVAISESFTAVIVKIQGYVFYVCGCSHPQELHGCLCRHSGMCECFVFIATMVSKSGTTIITEIQGYVSVLYVWMLSWMQVARLSL